VVSAGGHNHRVTVTDKVLLFISKDEFGIAFLDAEELVNAWVYLVTDFLMRLQTHHHKLTVFARE
jgi:nicotinate-nucleotide pyrophosphorylase